MPRKPRNEEALSDRLRNEPPVSVKAFEDDNPAVVMPPVKVEVALERLVI